MTRQRAAIIVAIALASALTLLHALAAPPPQAAKSARGNSSVGVAAFEAIVPVLRSPRCMNCHSRGDFPRQGDDSHRHTMNVRRGPLGNGIAGARCTTCHHAENNPGLHTPPGAPDWRLPPPATPMIWEGVSDHQLCELFKDPTQNGHHTIAGIVEHMHSPLVAWGWRPGPGRTPVPMPQSEFLASVKAWADNGAPCPE